MDLLNLSLANVLRLAWLVPTLPFLLASLPSSPLHRLVVGFSARGKRTATSSASKLGILMFVSVNLHLKSYYVVTPLSLGCSYAVEALNYAGSQITEYIVKGSDTMPNLEVDWLGLLKPITGLGWCQWVGGSIFFWGWLHQRNCHAILGSLRENKGVDEYVIPHGDWFRYVSCSHYFAEIVIYFGILVASGGSDPTIWFLFIFVVSNLVFEAPETHRWYRRKFENYPESRRAIIPFIY